METSGIKGNWKTIQTVVPVSGGVTVRFTSVPVVMILDGIAQMVSYQIFSIPFGDLGRIEIRQEGTENQWIVVLHAATKGFRLKWWPESIGEVPPDSATEVQLRFADRQVARDAFEYFLGHKNGR